MEENKNEQNITEYAEETKISTHLKNARKVHQWMIQNNSFKVPSRTSKNEAERNLGHDLANIRKRLIKSYEKLRTKKQKEEYKIKHPELEEVIEIINEIDNMSRKSFRYLKNIIEIKNWMEKNEATKLPTVYSENIEEQRLARALNNIKQELIRPYEDLQTKKEKNEYRKKNPEIDEILQILNDIKEKNIPVNLKNAREIQEWMQERNTKFPPNPESAYEDEKRLANTLNNIKYKIVKPFINLEIEEKVKYRKEHPEIDEIMQIISGIYENSKDKRNRDFSQLIQKNTDKRQQLKKAKEKEAKLKAKLAEKEQQKA